MDSSTELSDILRELRNGAESEARDLKRREEEAAQVEAFWDNLVKYLDKHWPIHILHLLERESVLLGRIRTTANENATSVISALSQNAQKNAAVLKRRFPDTLYQACQEDGLTIHRESRHPRYYFEDKFFTLEINDQRLLARLSDYEGRLDEFPADIGAIIETIQRERRRLFGRQFDGKQFLKKLRKEYLAVLKKEEQEDGASVPIRHITRRLGKNEKGFRSDEFLVDLSRLVTAGPLEITGRRLELQQTKDTHQGMLLHGHATHGYVGFVLFRKVEQ